MFKWKPTSTVADSLTVHLEWGFINTFPDSVFISMLDSLKDETARHDNFKHRSKQIKARYHYWLAIYESRHMNWSLARSHIKKAIELCDSSIYVYDMVRFKYLESLFIHQANDYEQYKIVKECQDYFEKTHDDFMYAWLALNIGEICMHIGELKRANHYYSTADTLLKKLRLENWHLKTSLNNANILFRLGNTKSSVTILDSLLSNPIASKDTGFYADVLISRYSIIKNKETLIKAESLLNSKLPFSIRLKIILALATHYSDENRQADVIRNLYTAMLLADSNSTLEQQCATYKLATEIYDQFGIKDSADIYFRKLSLLQDSLLAKNSSFNILNNEAREEIAKNDEQREHKIKIERMWTWLVIILIVFIAGITMFIVYHRLQSHKMANLRACLELEQERRKAVSSALAMTERDNVLKSVLSDISEMKESGEIGESKINRLEQNLKMHLSGRQDWENFKIIFEKVHPRFSTILKERYPSVSEGDIRLAIYLKAGMTTKQIARMLFLQPNSVKKNRQRLRRHMGLDADESPEDILRNIGNE